ncbi:MAG: glycine betaine ABC transporter substrate-binding protein, partial [Candidatus Caldatribacteriaceae bacterium]
MKTIGKMFVIVLLVGVLSGVVFAQAGKVVVSNKPFTESHILAEIMVQMLRRHTDLTVERLVIEGGTTSILHPAIVRGDIDIYPEYTGTSWQEVLRKDEVISDPLDLYGRV